MNAELKTIVEAARASGGVVVIEETTTTYRFEFGAVEGEATPATDSEPEETLTPAEAAEKVTAVKRVDEWADLLTGVPEAELTRAIKEKVLPARRKGEGADHNAIVVEPDDVRDYLKLCENVQRGIADPPAWWEKVRKQGNAIITA